MTIRTEPWRTTAGGERPLAVPRHWDLIGAPTGRLLMDLASAREALAAGRNSESAQISTRLLALLPGRRAAAVAAADADGTQQVDVIHACVLTVLGRAIEAAEPDQAQVRFAAAVAIFDRLVAGGAELKPAELVDHGTALARLDRLDEAFEAVVTALEALAAVPVDTIIRIVLTLRERHDLARAERLLQLAIDVEEDDPRLAQRLAETRLLDDRPEQAAAAYVRAGTHFGAGGQPGEALHCFEQAIGLSHDPVDAMMGRSFALADLAGPQVALEAIESVRDSHPELEVARAFQAQLLADLGRVEEALALLDSGLTMSPVDPVLMAARVRVLVTTGRRAEALDTVDEALVAWPGDVELRRLRARILRQSGRSAEALGVLQELLAEEVADLDDRVEMILTMVDLGRPVTALAETDHALLFTPDSADLLACRSMILLRLDRFRDALDAATRAVGLDHDHVMALSAQAQALLRLDRHDEARKPLGELLRLVPDSPEIRHTLGGLLLDGARYDDAEQLAVEGLRIHPGEPSLLLLQGKVRVLVGRFQDAVVVLERAERGLAKAGGPAAAVTDVQAHLGEALRRLGRDREALVHLDRALEAGPDNAFALGTKGQVLRASDKVEAERHLRRALELDSTLNWAHTELGELLRAEGRLAEALESYTAATDLAPQDAWAWGCRGATEYTLTRDDEAAASLARAIDLNDTYAWAWAVKGALLMDQDELADCLLALGRAVQLDPTIGWAWTIRGWAEELLGMREDARRSFRSALAAGGGGAWAEIGMADLLLQDGMPAQAEQRFRTILKAMSPRDALELAQAGWCHLRLDECRQAARNFGEALLLDDSMHSVRFDLALALLGTGPVERAVEAYEEAVTRLREVPSPGRRRAVLRIAAHDLPTVLTQPAYRETDQRSLTVLQRLLQPDGSAEPNGAGR
ncbi:tetratricopeptide repeat protein [Kitasatospora sp. NPDC049258]|uniref:tetratricopeptide repeat protein n=1 Tax=Kitasatospora sp. NPDC049258 TaxID=3155394 RepID=UPI00343CE02F